MIRAVLFDWGGTLARWAFEPALLERGHEAGMAALGDSAGLEPAAFTAAYVETLLPELLAERETEIDYADSVRRLLAELGIDADDEGVRRFVGAEHDVWGAAHALEDDALETLDSLRAEGLLVGLVSNLFDPPELSRARLGELGVLARLDAVALSAEVGVRKPAPAIFAHALAELEVPGKQAVFVGDRRREDVGGAGALGMRTILACWGAGDGGPGPEPHARAEQLADVPGIVDNWQ